MPRAIGRHRKLSKKKYQQKKRVISSLKSSKKKKKYSGGMSLTRSPGSVLVRPPPSYAKVLATSSQIRTGGISYSIIAATLLSLGAGMYILFEKLNNTVSEEDLEERERILNQENELETLIEKANGLVGFAEGQLQQLTGVLEGENMSELTDEEVGKFLEDFVTSEHNTFTDEEIDRELKQLEQEIEKQSGGRTKRKKLFKLSKLIGGSPEKGKIVALSLGLLGLGGVTAVWFLYRKSGDEQIPTSENKVSLEEAAQGIIELMVERNIYFPISLRTLDLLLDKIYQGKYLLLLNEEKVRLSNVIIKLLERNGGNFVNNKLRELSRILERKKSTIGNDEMTVFKESFFTDYMDFIKKQKIEDNNNLLKLKENPTYNY